MANLLNYFHNIKADVAYPLKIRKNIENMWSYIEFSHKLHNDTKYVMDVVLFIQIIIK